MTDTPRSNEISPVVFMGSGGPDLTPDERIARLEAENSRLRGALLVIEWNATQNAPTDSGRIARAALRYMGWSDD